MSQPFFVRFLGRVRVPLQTLLLTLFVTTAGPVIADSEPTQTDLRARVEQQIQSLGSANVATREKAQHTLEAIGLPAVQFLAIHLNTPDAKLRKEVEQVITRIRRIAMGLPPQPNEEEFRIQEDLRTRIEKWRANFGKARCGQEGVGLGIRIKQTGASTIPVLLDYLDAPDDQTRRWFVSSLMSTKEGFDQLHVEARLLNPLAAFVAVEALLNNGDSTVIPLGLQMVQDNKKIATWGKNEQERTKQAQSLIAALAGYNFPSEGRPSPWEFNKDLTPSSFTMNTILASHGDLDAERALLAHLGDPKKAPDVERLIVVGMDRRLVPDLKKLARNKQTRKIVVRILLQLEPEVGFPLFYEDLKAGNSDLVQSYFDLFRRMRTLPSDFIEHLTPLLKTEDSVPAAEAIWRAIALTPDEEYLPYPKDLFKKLPFGVDAVKGQRISGSLFNALLMKSTEEEIQDLIGLYEKLKGHDQERFALRLCRRFPKAMKPMIEKRLADPDPKTRGRHRAYMTILDGREATVNKANDLFKKGEKTDKGLLWKPEDTASLLALLKALEDQRGRDLLPLLRNGISQNYTDGDAKYVLGAILNLGIGVFEVRDIPAILQCGPKRPTNGGIGRPLRKMDRKDVVDQLRILLRSKDYRAVRQAIEMAAGLHLSELVEELRKHANGTVAKELGVDLHVDAQKALKKIELGLKWPEKDVKAMLKQLKSDHPLRRKAAAEFLDNNVAYSGHQFPKSLFLVAAEALQDSYRPVRKQMGSFLGSKFFMSNQWFRQMGSARRYRPTRHRYATQQALGWYREHEPYLEWRLPGRGGARRSVRQSGWFVNYWAKSAGVPVEQWKKISFPKDVATDEQRLAWWKKLPAKDQKRFLK